MTTIQHCPNLEIVKLDTEWIVINANTCTTTKLNATGGHILSLLEHPSTLEMLVAQLQKSYEGLDAVAENEINEYLHKLELIGLIETVAVRPNL